MIRNIEKYQTLGQFCESLYLQLVGWIPSYSLYQNMDQGNPVSVMLTSLCSIYLQIEGWILHRVILSLLCIQYFLMDRAHTVPPISGMDSVYPLYLCTRITQSV